MSALLKLLITTLSKSLDLILCHVSCQKFTFKQINIGVRFLIAKNEIIEETEILAYGIVSFLAEFGGALGLFLGFSFYSLWDLAEPISNKISKFMK